MTGSGPARRRPPEFLDRTLPPWAASAVRQELVLWRAMWLAVRGRGDIPPDGEGIPHSARLRPRFWVFLFVFPIEIVLFEVLLPWGVARVVVFVLGVLGLLWYLALIATLYTYPHTIDSSTLRLRWSAFSDHSVPVAKIESVRFAERRWEVRRSAEVVGGVLVMEMEKETNVVAQLREPHQVDLGGQGVQEITAVAFWADDAPKAVALVRRRLGG